MIITLKWKINNIIPIYRVYIYICSSSLSLSVLQLELIDIHFYSLLNQLPRYPCAINTYTRKKQVIQRWRITCNDERTPYSNNRLWTLSAFGEREKRKEEKVRISQCTQLDSLSKELFIPNSSSSILLLFSVQSKRVHE